MRHAITPGKARELLEAWAGLPAFITATDANVRPIRMDDRELVLRFLAFFQGGLQSYKQPDMDGFLITAMQQINATSDDDLAAMRLKFVSAMKAAFGIFGQDAFRKRFDKAAGRLPINKAVFEALSVNLASLTDKQLATLQTSSEAVRDGFIALCHDRSFESAISQGTGDIRKVNRRFSAIRELIARVLADA